MIISFQRFQLILAKQLQLVLLLNNLKHDWQEIRFILFRKQRHVKMCHVGSDDLVTEMVWNKSPFLGAVHHHLKIIERSA